MSLYGALMTGVAGLDANSNALSIASANIANVNTVAYKTGENVFSTMLASSAGEGDISSGSVISHSVQNITQQGLLSSTASPTDLAISGNGFFVVSQKPGDTSTQLFTRAGDFAPDADGNLRNSSGFYLMGWPLDASGNIPSDRNAMTAINVNNLSGKAEATTTMSLQANLQASTDVHSGYTAGDMTSGKTTPDFQRTISIYDSQGGSQPLTISYLKTGANSWSYEVSYAGNAANITGSNPIATGTMSFNADGTLATADTSASSPTGSISMTIPWNSTSGLSPQTLSLNMGTVGSSSGLTQYDSPSTLVSSSVDGALFGNLTGVKIDNDGYVTAQFSNGLSQKIFKLPVATFTNPDGLNAISGNAYEVSPNSGSAVLGEATTGGAGSIQANALEGSTVDLANEFTNLITTQRAYSASARIVTTASQMLDQLLQMSH